MFNVSSVEPRVKCRKLFPGKLRTTFSWQTEVGIPKIRDRRGRAPE